MKNKTLLIYSLLVLATFVRAQENYDYYYFDKKVSLQPSGDRFLIKFKQGVSNNQINAINSQFTRSRKIETNKFPLLYILHTSMKDNTQLEKLKNSPDIDFASPVFISQNGKEEAVLNQFVAKFKQGVSLEEIQALNLKYGVIIIEDLNYIENNNRYLLGIEWNNKKNIFDVANIYNENRLVEYASPDMIIFDANCTTSPNDTYYPNQWNMGKINAPLAWDITTGSQNIIVAVTDNGVDLTHEDLDSKLVQGWDFYNNDNDPQPYGSDYHGTACAGIIAAETNTSPSQGIAGVSWNSKIMPIKISEGGNIVYSTVANGVTWAKQNNADIINMSIGGGSYNEDLATAINSAATQGRNGKGCIIVCSGGNNADTGDPDDDVVFPALLANVIAVGATNENDARWNYSNQGPGLDVVAPTGQKGGNGNIYTTDIMGALGKTATNYNSYFGGTSASAPLVSGIAALILSCNSSLTREQVTNIIQYTAIDLGPSGRDNDYGWGRVEAYSAVKSAARQYTLSGALTRHEVWYGVVNLSGNVEVPSNKRLVILSGTTLNMGSYKISSTGGSIIIEDGVSGVSALLKDASNNLKSIYGSIQAAANYAPAGYRVDLLPGTFSENVSISSKNNVTIYGTTSTYLTGTFTFYGCSSCTTLNSTYNQINAYYSNYCAFNSNLSGSSSQTGIGLYYCTDFNHGGANVSGYNTGLLASGSSGYSQLSNYSSNNTSILASSGANVNAFGNRYCQSITCDYYAELYGQIYSTSCYFYGGSPRCTTRTGGTVNHTGSMSCPLAKTNDDIDEQADFEPMQIESDDPIEQEFLIINSSYFNLMKRIKEDKVKGISDYVVLKNQFLKIAEDFKAFIKKYPNSSFARVGLTTAATSFGLFSKEDGFTDAADKNKSFLDEIIIDKELTSLKGTAEVLMIDYYSTVKDFNSAISQADAVLNKYNEDSELSCDAMFKKGLLLSYEMKQPEKAADCFTAILKNYPENPIAGFAENQLIELGYNVQKDEGDVLLTDKSKFTSSAYPNPFNPSTTIRFNLPEEGKVIVKVFDILGREVAVLINGYMQPGSHNVVWSGKDSYGSEVSSGVYFYNIRYNDQSLTKKMMLVR